MQSYKGRNISTLTGKKRSDVNIKQKQTEVMILEDLNNILSIQEKYKVSEHQNENLKLIQIVCIFKWTMT